MAKEKFNISFKKEKAETGLAAVGYSRQSVSIKLNKLFCGLIKAPNWMTKDNKYGISVTVYKDEIKEGENCDWCWITFKQRFDTEEDARQWVKDNLKAISEKYKLRCCEPYC